MRESLPAHHVHREITNCRQLNIPADKVRYAAWRVRIVLVGTLSLSLCFGLELARGQSIGSPCLTAPTLLMRGIRIVNVASVSQLQSAMGNLQSGDTVVLANGTYNLTSTLNVNGRDNVTIRGNSGCDQVVLVGRGMDNVNHGSVLHGVWSNSRNTLIAHLTIRDTYDNSIVFNAGAQSPRVYSVRLLNAGSQFIKANPTDIGQGIGVDKGIVEYSSFEYTGGPPTTDHGPGLGYTNGLSLHAADNWIIRNNRFKDFHMPDSYRWIWNPAVLVWNHSGNTLTEKNVFINVDRAIAYGIQDTSGSDHHGGTIRNNFVYLQPGLMSASRKASSDAQIIVWDSPKTKVYHNTVVTNSNVFKSLEFRFNTTGAEARNNLADTPIGTRDGASFSQSGNLLTATSALFVNPSAGDLHLKSTAIAVIDQAPILTSVTDDIDGNLRPFGSASDIGADEFGGTGGGDIIPPGPPTNLKAQ
jgi:hypothetical protein